MLMTAQMIHPMNCNQLNLRIARTPGVPVILILLLLLLLSLACPTNGARTRRAETRPKPHAADEYAEPLSESEVRTMVKDGPIVIREVAFHQMAMINNTINVKAAMDSFGPLILHALQRIEKMQAALPAEQLVRLNTTDTRIRFLASWRECNDTFDKSRHAAAVNHLMGQIGLGDLREALINMSLPEQINMRKSFTTAREKLMEMRNSTQLTRYREEAQRIIGSIHKQLADLMSIQTNLQYIQLMDRTGLQTRRHVVRLLHELDRHPLIPIIATHPNNNQ